MIPVLLSLFLTTVGASSFVVEAPVDAKYTPDWDSLDSRPLPYWYDEAKVGIFLHWGVYSVPSFGSEWFWWNWQGAKNADYSKYMTKHYKPGFAYQEFGRDFTAELWNPSEWADLFEASGARYVVLTSKHHDGFCLWPTRHSFGWNSKDVGPHRDLIGELRDAILKKKDIRFGLYHSLFEWFNPLYLADKGQNFSSQVFVDSKVIPEMREIIERYQPLVLWSDGEWEADEEYWKSKEFIAWLYNESPVREHVVTNDRWGRGVNCKHGDFYTCSDRYNPGTLQKHKWENAMTLDKHSWGHRTEMKLADILTIEELISELVSTVSCGGNLLVNVGPTSVGTINPIFEERLRQMGEWLKVNGEAIYESRPWVFQNDSVTKGVWYTAGAPNTVYAIVLQYPYDTNFVALKAPAGLIEGSLVELLGYSEPLEVIASKDGVIVKFPSKNLLDKQGLKVAWTLKFKVRPNSVS